ncbi:hypothetical protein [uncultured Microbulbifer sp.]|uniref:hypothetical protein n=1 Tax=uncultured Microbulbifer sp. TaxID=348147 RepID=UPI002618B8C7|nr:hypothetical protein [uncultured Microbulbifer sp.]
MAADDNETVRRILLELGVLQSGEQPSYGEYVDVRDMARSLYAELWDNYLIIWPIDDPPISSQDAWIKYVAGRCANLFGIKDAGVLMRADEARRRLIAIAASYLPETEIPVCDF